MPLLLRQSFFLLLPRSELQKLQAETNKNVNWLSSPWFWLAYVLLLCSIRFAIYLFTPPNNEKWGWTALNLTHGVISFYALHWKRGSPIWEDQGEYIGETVWEQVDNGVAFTPSRKFLMLVPGFLLVNCPRASAFRPSESA